MVRTLCCLCVVIMCVFWKAQGDDKCESYNLVSVVALVIQVKTELMAEQGKMQNTITSQANKIKQMERKDEADQEKMHNTIASQTNKINQMERYIEALEKKNQAVPVGFSVNKIDQVSSGVMTFSNSVINTDQAYNLTTGTFTCQTPGFYYFFFSLGKMSSYTTTASCYIRKNGVTLTYGQTVSDIYSPIVSSVYVNLDKGDKVALQGCTESAWTMGYSSSSFSGFLVTPGV